MNPQILLILTTLPDLPSADRIANVLVEGRLAACATRLPQVQSTYRLQGRVERAEEVMLFIKTSPERYRDVEEAIRMHHPDEVPEILAFHAEALPAYLRWLVDSTSPAGGLYA